ncbi:poly A polymerase, partial [Hydrogenivirga sp. 128-5-R1-1]
MYNFKQKLEKYFPEKIVNTLKDIGKIAKKLNMKVYLVGGIVRDIIMQRENLDIDIIVEGDAIKLAKEFAKKKKGKFNKFEEFMTAQVKVGNIKFDFATARKEIYEYPGAYPKVQKSNLKEDLYRRDFTINTLAINLTQDNFGILIDYFNSLQDIKNGKIRILHQLSFIEDPIRIFRALRFSGRFNFSLGKTTEKLLKIAIDQNLIKAAAPGRLNLELNLTFNEEKVVEILNLMYKYKVLNQIIPYFEMTEERLIILEKIRDYYIFLTSQLNFKVNKSSVYLLSLMYHLPVESSISILKKLHFEEAIKIFEEFFKIKNKINTGIKNSILYKILKEIKPETTLFLISYLPSEISQKILEVLNKSKERIITGKDLIN